MKKSIKLTLTTLGFIAISVYLLLNSCTKDSTPTPNPNPNVKDSFNIAPNYNYFGIVENNTSREHNFTIKNNDKTTIIISDIAIEGENKTEFSTNIKKNTVVNKNTNYNFKVYFKPTKTGSKVAILKIVVNNKDYKIKLSGDVFSKNDLKNQQDAWVFFKNKPDSNTFLSNPNKMLSAKAIARRKKQGIKFDIKDVPIHKEYYNKVKNSFGINVLAKSKWLNAVHIYAPTIIINTLKEKNNFVSSIEYADRSLNQKTKNFVAEQTYAPLRNKFEPVKTDFNYGATETQIKMLNADFLHKQGFTGKGIVIAVIDAGFPNVNTLAPFKRIRDNKQILGGYDFVERNTNFYTGNSHGTHVLSTIAGYIKSEKTNFVGTAPDASFYLFRSENADKEEPVEESLWVEAAERADSLGVDIINTSLGYTKFDNPKYSHVYADLDGKTAFMSRGAEIAASRGMIVINAAGNDGDKEWKYVGVPADAKSVLTVGAVSRAKVVVDFSSRGPTADGRTKPDVMALGFLAIITHFENGYPSITNGTSFASPIMAGAVACLRQAYPNKKASTIIEEVKKGGDKYTAPNNNHGYGIPNFEQIFNNLK